VDDASSASSTSSSSNSAAIDSRRYTKWDKSASTVDDATDFSFDDFLDMVNPLEHIPVVSSVYRAITNENIHPVARVAGDIMYGGIFGVASAISGGLGAAVDSMSVASTGHDATGYVLASIFGTDDDKTSNTQLAANTPAPAPASSSDLTQNSNAVATLAALNAPLAQSGGVTPASLSTSAPSSASDPAAATGAAAANLKGQKAYPLYANSKLPYGGAMAMPDAAAQNTAIALAEGSHSMRMGNMIYTNPLMNGPHPLPVATSKIAPGFTATNAAVQADAAAAANSVAPAVATQTDNQASANPNPQSQIQAQATASADAGFKTSPQRNPIPQNLVDDMVMLQALKQYKGIAAGPASSGTTIDLTN
ncbi:MAG TPA: hypothetical protein VFR09_04180, partial [Alphaproteobacteria bacterium]|nr:hypothetical protein [Alphaproteobacteria bacterium]